MLVRDGVAGRAELPSPPHSGARRASHRCASPPARFALVSDSVQPPVAGEPEYDANGVDRTLVRYVLAMSPAERARTHDRLLADVETLEAAGRAARDG